MKGRLATRGRRLAGSFLIFCVAGQGAQAAAPAEKAVQPTQSPAGSYLLQASNLLVRDPAVQEELRLRSFQVEQIDGLLEKADRVPDGAPVLLGNQYKLRYRYLSQAFRLMPEFRRRQRHISPVI